VDIVQPQGVGDLKLQFEELKLKLDQEGLFELSRKRQIPSFPNKIGVATSPTGAVWHDIQNVVNRRYPLVELILAPTLVQGADASANIVDAIGCLNQIADLDVILLARGGGSLEDLWPFNEESVARSIFASQVPIISGIGHETDSTISDLVADQFASTPSVAAEMVVPSSVDLISRIIDSQHILTTSAKNLYGTKSNSLIFLDTNLRGFKFGFDNLRQQTDDLLSGALKSIRRDFAQLSERTRSIMMRLESLSPEDTLRRGYAIVQTHNDTVVKDFSQINPGEMVDVTLSCGGFEAKVQSVSSDDQK
jgi:exodeoxyribonuclease VII large subunit